MFISGIFSPLLPCYVCPRTLANPLAIVCFSSVYGIDLLVELMRHAWWRCLVLCKKNQQYRTWLQARNHHCFHVFRSSEQLNL